MWWQQIGGRFHDWGAITFVLITGLGLGLAPIIESASFYVSQMHKCELLCLL